jgi:DNA-binding LytR/AlgR family response regulator
MINCIIIDDQKEAIEILTSHVKNKAELNLLGAFTNPLEALIFIENNKVDLVFIDVQMPHLNGLDFIETIRLKNGNNIPKFILVTGYDKYAIEGFEAGVIDYLMKPISYKRFNISVDRAISNFFGNDTKNNSTNTDFFFAEYNGKKIKINYSDIAYIEAGGNYITLFWDNIKILLYRSLSSMQEILPATDFIRIHKSYIVSISHIEAIKGNEIYLKLGNANTNLPIGAAYKDNLLSVLNI